MPTRLQFLGQSTALFLARHGPAASAEGDVSSGKGDLRCACTDSPEGAKPITRWWWFGLTGGVAHDFNNLLTVILGNVDRLKRAGGTPRIVQAAEQIEQAAERAAELTRRLLVFARRQPLQPRLVDLNELVRGLQPMLARLLEEDVTFKMNLAASACVADVDPVQTETALMNLCVNARDAMPEGGLLVVETATTALDERYARLNADVTPGRYVTIAVSDTGAGIPPQDLARVFEPFFTTKERC